MKKIINWIIQLYLKLNTVAKKIVPVAVKATQALKTAIDTGKIDQWADILKSFLPDAGDLIVDQIEIILKKIVPRLAIQLEIIDAVVDAENPGEQFRLIAEKIMEGIPEEKRQKLLSQVMQQLAVDLSDGNLSWGEAGAYGELFYKQLYK